MKIYVVIGSVGEYSDRYEWCVKAFPTEVAAQQFVIDATQHGQAMYEKYHGAGNVPAEAYKYDSEFSWDYSGPAKYHLNETELVEEDKAG